MRRVVLLAALAVLALPASAAAQLPKDWPLWVEIAERAFPGACEPVEVVISEEQHPTKPDASAWAVPWGCRVVVGQRFPAFRGSAQCAIVVHEWGHLAGLGHSEDPASVMYPEIRTVPAECLAIYQRRCKRVKRQLRRVLRRSLLVHARRVVQRRWNARERKARAHKRRVCQQV